MQQFARRWALLLQLILTFYWQSRTLNNLAFVTLLKPQELHKTGIAGKGTAVTGGGTSGKSDSSSSDYQEGANHVLSVIHDILAQHRSLEARWHTKKIKLHQRLALRLFQEDVKQVLDWLQNHGEVFLRKNIGIGRNLQKARAYQKSHQTFEGVVQVTEKCFVFEFAYAVNCFISRTRIPMPRSCWLQPPSWLRLGSAMQRTFTQLPMSLNLIYLRSPPVLSKDGGCSSLVSFFTLIQMR